jgi:hypothetical protein
MEPFFIAAWAGVGQLEFFCIPPAILKLFEQRINVHPPELPRGARTGSPRFDRAEFVFDTYNS